ncbi:MAG: hypothetical protein FK730_11245 [Asgard group archaeon]|nr:hypothetical protein [Asgard group archaeon]
MIRENLSLKLYRLILFPVLILVELALLVLLLVMPFYSTSTLLKSPGYATIFGWLLAALALLSIVGMLLLIITSFELKGSKATQFFHDMKKIRILTIVIISIIFIQIAVLAITQNYYTIFDRSSTSITLLILALSLILPVFFYFIANFEERIIPYSLSTDVPLRLKLTTLWLVFLAGAMQILAIEWGFIIIGVFVLLTAIYFFLLNRYAAILTPSILLIHFTFSAAIGIVSLVNKEDFMQEIINTGGSITDFQVYAIVIFVFFIPGLISLILAQSFFRKWVLAWIRDVQPKPEMEIKLEMAD